MSDPPAVTVPASQRTVTLWHRRDCSDVGHGNPSSGISAAGFDSTPGPARAWLSGSSGLSLAQQRQRQRHGPPGLTGSENHRFAGPGPGYRTRRSPGPRNNGSGKWSGWPRTRALTGPRADGRAAAPTCLQRDNQLELDRRASLPAPRLRGPACRRGVPEAAAAAASAWHASDHVPDHTQTVTSSKINLRFAVSICHRTII